MMHRAPGSVFGAATTIDALPFNFSFGSVASFRAWYGHFRFTPINGPRHRPSACLKGANNSRFRT
jgi:hypothetical protein